MDSDYEYVKNSHAKYGAFEGLGDKIEEIDRLTYIIWKQGIHFSDALTAAETAFNYFEEKATHGS